MNRPVELKTKTRPQLALESYLDALLQEATAQELPEPILVLEPAVEPEAALDEFQLAVLEEQARDAQIVVPITPTVVAPVVAAPVVVAPVVVEPVVEVHLPPSITPPPVTGDGRPAWAAEPFECLLFDVAGLTLAVPLVCLGSIYSLEGQELTPLFGQPEWFLGILPSQAGNLKVLDTARWVMPDRYRDDFRQGLQYVISVQGYEWGAGGASSQPLVAPGPERNQMAQPPGPTALAGGYRDRTHVRVARRSRTGRVDCQWRGQGDATEQTQLIEQ